MENEQFIKLTKKEKLLLPYSEKEIIYNVQKVLFLPLKSKNDGYTMCAFFVESTGKWFRLADYDCFRFMYSGYMLKGDFENGGVQFFLEGGWRTDYGGEFHRI